MFRLSYGGRSSFRIKNQVPRRKRALCVSNQLRPVCYCGGKLPGRVNRAASCLRATSQKQYRQRFLTEFLKIWLAIALHAPLRGLQAITIAARRHSLPQTRLPSSKLLDTEGEGTEVVSLFPHQYTSPTTEPTSGWIPLPHQG